METVLAVSLNHLIRKTFSEVFKGNVDALIGHENGQGKDLGQWNSA